MLFQEILFNCGHGCKSRHLVAASGSGVTDCRLFCSKICWGMIIDDIVLKDNCAHPFAVTMRFWAVATTNPAHSASRTRAGSATSKHVRASGAYQRPVSTFRRVTRDDYGTAGTERGTIREKDLHATRS